MVGNEIDFGRRGRSRKNKRSVGTTNLLNLNRWQAFYMRQLRNLVWQMFEWKNLPPTIHPEFLERTLHQDGQIAFYNDPELGKMCIKGAYINLNPYGEPLEYQAAMWRYNRRFDLYNQLIPINIAKNENLGIYCTNMFEGMASSQEALVLFATLLAENKMTYLVAQNNLKVPFILETSPENELTARNIYHNIVNNEPAIFIDKTSGMMENIKIHHTNPTSNNDALERINLAKTEILNEFLDYFGIDNFSTTKKERLITNEISANATYIAHSRNKFLFPRQMAATHLNQIWGTNITVELRGDIREIIQSELGLNSDLATHEKDS